MDKDDTMQILQKCTRRLRAVRGDYAVRPVLRHVRRALLSLELAQFELRKFRGWEQQAPTTTPITPRSCAITKAQREGMTMADEINPHQFAKHYSAENQQSSNPVADSAPLQPARPAEPPQRIETSPHLNVPIPTARPTPVPEYRGPVGHAEHNNGTPVYNNPEGEKR